MLPGKLSQQDVVESYENNKFTEPPWANKYFVNCSSVIRCNFHDVQLIN